MTAKSLTVATYNICHGRYADFDFTRLTAPIRAAGADIVGIQEVDMYTARSRHIDSVSALSEASGLPYTLFVATMPYDGGHYGTAILSRYPLNAGVVVPLDVDTGLEPRAFGCVSATLSDGQALYFLNTHLSYKSADCRRLQVRALADWMAARVPADAPCILTGDFNTQDDGDLAPLTSGRMDSLNRARRYLTFRDNPLAIDHILYTRESLAPVASGMIDSDASDHNLLWCRFERA